jgi:hypothetical protein
LRSVSRKDHSYCKDEWVSLQLRRGALRRFQK